MIGSGKNKRGRQFVILFDPFDKNYKIRDLGVGFGAFGKI